MNARVCARRPDMEVLPSAVVSLGEVRREILGSLDQDKQREIAREFTRESFRVPSDLKVSCPFGGCTGACSSPSKRDPGKSRRTWVCGSNFSHDDRMGCCVSYRRLHYGVRDGVRCRRRSR